MSNATSAGVNEVDLPVPDGDRFCTLSLCIPHDSELEAFASDGYYGIETRKGVLEADATASPAVWKRRVLALEEGSILPRRTPPHGHNPIVADAFSDSVQQYGYALPVAMRALEGANEEPSDRSGQQIVDPLERASEPRIHTLVSGGK